MCTKEAEIHDNVKQKIVDSDERNTVHIFRTLRNTARVFKNKVSMEIVKIENRPGGAEFKDIQHLASGARGKTVYTSGDIDAGVWSAGITVGLIHDIVSERESRSSLFLPALGKEVADVSIPSPFLRASSKPSCEELIANIERDAEAHIKRMAGIVGSSSSERQSRL